MIRVLLLVTLNFQSDGRFDITSNVTDPELRIATSI